MNSHIFDSLLYLINTFAVETVIAPLVCECYWSMQHSVLSASHEHHAGCVFGVTHQYAKRRGTVTKYILTEQQTLDC